MFRTLCLAAAAAALATPAAAQMRSFNAQIENVDLGGGLYMLIGRGGNIGLSIGPDGAFMIDDQFAPLTDRIERAIRELGGTGEVRFIVNTHYHGDHTGGNEEWAGRGAVIFGHDNVRERLMEAQISTLSGEPTPPGPEGGWPTVTFAEGVTFHMNDDTVHVIHVPHAHTDGDSIVHFEEGDVVHMGDVFWNGLFPYIDTNAGGSIDGNITALDFALTLMGEDTQIIPGHGPLADRADVEAALAMLMDVRARIYDHVARGDTLEETIAAMPLEQDYALWGGGFINVPTFTRLVYDDLARFYAPE